MFSKRDAIEFNSFHCKMYFQINHISLQYKFQIVVGVIRDTNKEIVKALNRGFYSGRELN